MNETESRPLDAPRCATACSGPHEALGAQRFPDPDYAYSRVQATPRSPKLQAREVSDTSQRESDSATDLAVLFVEDSEGDATIVARELRRNGFAPVWERVETPDELRDALKRRAWHVVISDSSVPRLDPLEALRVTKEVEPQLPFIVVSGTVPAELAVEAMRRGAADWVGKDALQRLAPAIRRELSREHASVAIGHRLLAAQEAERRLIARSLHDELGQVLIALRMTLEAARRKTGTARARHVDEALQLTEEAVAQLRTVSVGLWPTILDDLGLTAALRWLGQRDGRGEGVTITVDVDDVERLPFSIEVAAFRVVQEALTNALRHASARTIAISMRAQPDALVLEVRDDGTGFDMHSAWLRATAGESLGLASMRERVALVGGRFEIESSPGNGTSVRARVPLNVGSSG